MFFESGRRKSEKKVWCSLFALQGEIIIRYFDFTLAYTKKCRCKFVFLLVLDSRKSYRSFFHWWIGKILMKF